MLGEVKQEVNIEKIMEEIREQIRREEGMSDIPAFEDIPLRGEEPTTLTEWPADSTEAEKENNWPFLIKSLQYLNNNYDIPYYWSLGPSSVKPLPNGLYGNCSNVSLRLSSPCKMVSMHMPFDA